MTDPTLAPFRIHMGAEGHVISGSKKILDEHGVAYIFDKFKGWDEPPALATDTKKRAGNHGMTAGASWQAERNLVLEGWIIAPGDNPGQLRDAIDRLFSAIPLRDELLVVHENGLTRHLYVRQGGQPTADRIGRKEGRNRVTRFSIQLVALNPIRLSGDGSGPTKRYSTDPGEAAGSVTVETGLGLVPPMLLTIGSCTNPRITVDGSPGALWFETVVPYSGLQINLQARTAVAGGQSVAGSMRGRWPVLARKRNTFTLTADEYADGGLTVDTYDSSP